MINLSEYYKGRDRTHASELTQSLRDNAERTVEAANKLLEAFGEDRECTSGWRPAAINARTPGADPNSPHVTCEAIDLSDRDGKLKRWALANPQAVIEAGFVAMEDPSITTTWAHFQTRPALRWQKGRRILLAANDWKNKAGETMLTGEWA